jgi:peptide/nickel transport system permease protein
MMPRRLPPPAALPVVAIVLLALAVPLLRLPDPLALDVAHRLAGPSARHWLGRDEFGRDEFSRLLWGARVSLGVSAGASLLAAAAGVPLGLTGGFFGGVAELLAVRSMDIVLCFPPLLLALLVVTLLGPGATTLVPLLAVLFVPGFVRVTQAGVLAVRTQDFVTAMRALGAGPARILLRTILPNVAGPVLVQFSLTAAAALVLESGLSFLGLGVVPPAPSWGLMIAAARTTMAQTPLLLLWPCLALSLTILALNGLCDALRDRLDPQGRPRRPRAVVAAFGGLLPASGRVLDMAGLTLAIDAPSGPVHPVRDVTLGVSAGETLAVVGESGSGKSLAALAVMGLLPDAVRVAGGIARLAGQDVLRLDEPGLRRLRGRRVAMVFQDPLSSLNPVHRIGTQVAEALRAHRPLPARAAAAAARALLARVGLPDPARVARAFPHELSGGMRQRAMIAIAIANDPDLLIADEPTTALDATVQAQVLDLLAALGRTRRMALIFITHNLPLVAAIADRVAVMYAGQVVEEAPTAVLLAHPLHPYTAALLASVPGGGGGLPTPIPGSVPAPHALPRGCAFAPRCVHVRPACAAAEPPMQQATPDRQTRCLRWADLP